MGNVPLVLVLGQIQAYVSKVESSLKMPPPRLTRPMNIPVRRFETDTVGIQAI